MKTHKSEQKIEDSKSNEFTADKSDKWHRIILQTAMDGFWVTDIHGKILEVNDTYCRMIGYNEQELLTMHIPDLDANENPEDTAIHIHNIMANGSDRFETMHRRKDGTIIDLEVSTQYLDFDDGKFVAFLRDISNKKAAELELKESNDKFSILASNLTSFIAIVNADTLKYEFINEAYEKYFNLPKDKIIGCHVKDVISEANYKFALPYINEVKKGKSISYENSFDLTIGKRWIEVNYSPVFDNERNVIKIVLLNYDITARKLNEEALRESEERWRTIVKNEPECVKLIDEEGNLLEMNPAGLEMIQATSDQVIGEKAVGLVAEEDKNAFNEMIEGVFRGEKRHLIFDMIGLQGRRLTLETTSVPLYDATQTGTVKALVGVTRDITARKIAEQALKDSEQKYRNVIENIHEALIMEDVDGNVIYANKEFYEMFGFPKDKKNLNLKEYTSPKSYQEILQRHHKRMSGDNVEEEFQYEGIKTDGSTLWLEARVTPLYENGKIIGTLSLEKNITDRRKALELIKHNEEKFRTLFESNRYGISIFFGNPDNSISKFVEANEAAATMLGYTRDEFLGLSPIDLEDISNPNIIRERQMKLMQFGFIDFETELKHKDGSKRIVDMTTKAIRYENRFALMNIVRDITEKKKVEAELQYYSNQLKDAMELGRLSWWELDCTTNIITFDLSTIQSFGIGIKETTEFSDFMELVHFEDRELMVHSMTKHIEGVTEYFRFEYRIKSESGDYKWLYDVARVSNRDLDGAPLTITGMVMDISERKRFEQELIEAKERAEQNDKLKTSFLQNISHEIRTPLNGIMGFSSLLKESDGTDMEERDQYIDIILSSSSRLLGIIDDVLEMSRLSSGIIQCNNTEIKIEEIIKYFTSVYSSKIQVKGLKYIVTASAESKSTTIYLDKDKLYQIISNLFNNAIKFTNQGEIEFAISAKNDNLVLSIRDTGIGIIEEYQDKIFERFWQYEAFSRKAYGGTGLGLSISKEIASIIDVSIEVNSQYGSGSTFSIIIPEKNIMNTQDEKSMTENSTTSTIDLSDKSILVVEDEVTNYIYLEKLLEREKAEIFWVENGLDAVEIAKNMDFDLILMDIKLPIMDGIEATRKIKLFKPNMVIVAQTAYTTPEDRARAIDAGCDDFISKPMRKEDLYKILKSALKQ